MNADTCLVEKTASILLEIADLNASKKFLSMFSEWRNGGTSLIGVTPIIQIRIMNMFWREKLLSIPNSLEARSWLINEADLDVYLREFRNDWGLIVVHIGVLS